MSPVFKRRRLNDDSFIEGMIEPIARDAWRPHGVRFRLAWIQNDICRVLFDNHHGKADHVHIDGEENSYHLVNEEKLWSDFISLIIELGGEIK